jgi:hypothetical protein
MLIDHNLSVCRFIGSMETEIPMQEIETKNTTTASMSKKQTIGLILMLGSAAAGIQMTVFFSLALKGWFYSICLGILILVFAYGADMFRGNES